MNVPRLRREFEGRSAPLAEHRRSQPLGRRRTMVFLALGSGENSERGIGAWVEEQRWRLKRAFGFRGDDVPSYSTIQRPYKAWMGPSWNARWWRGQSSYKRPRPIRRGRASQLTARPGAGVTTGSMGRWMCSMRSGPAKGMVASKPAPRGPGSMAQALWTGPAWNKAYVSKGQSFSLRPQKSPPKCPRG